MSINARVRRYERTRFVSFGFEIVENFRDKSQQPAPSKHRMLKRIGSVKDADRLTLEVQKDFWKKIDSEIFRLMRRGKISENDRAKLIGKFAEFLPRPVSMPVLPIKSKISLAKYPLGT